MNDKKEIWSYFTETVEFPREVAHNPLPYGTVWVYISSTFLNGFINYVQPISCFVVDRYTPPDQALENKKFRMSKKNAIESIISGKENFSHTDLHCLEDDIILLAEIEVNEKDVLNKFMFFWFDCDVSDCCIGKFETADTKEQVIESVKNWLEK